MGLGEKNAGKGTLVSSQRLESPFLPWEADRKCATQRHSPRCCRLLMKYSSGGESHASELE